MVRLESFLKKKNIYVYILGIGIPREHNYAPTLCITQLIGYIFCFSDTNSSELSFS
jgi:hypothetical protein